VKVRLEGEAHNLPADTKYEIHYMILDDQATEPHESVSPPLPLKGNALEHMFDRIWANACGACSIDVSVLPIFPFADQKPAGSFILDQPLDIAIDPDPSGDTPVFMGTVVSLTPQFDWPDSVLRLRMTEEVPTPDGKGTPDHRTTAEYYWRSDDAAPTVARTWSVGCARDDGDGKAQLTYPEAGMTDVKPYVVAFCLEVANSDEAVFRQVWEKAGWTVLRPTLVSLAVDIHPDLAAALRDPDDPISKVAQFAQENGGHAWVYGTVQVCNLAPGMNLPIDLRLWGFHPVAGPWSDPDPPDTEYAIVPLAVPTADARVAIIGDDGTARVGLVDLAALESEAYLPIFAGHFFVVARVPAALTGTDDPVPFCEVFDYDDDVFTPFAEEDFAVVVPPPDNAKKKKKSKKPAVPGKTSAKIFGVAVASQEVQGKHATHLPSFGDIKFGTRGDSLLVQTHVAGPPAYWQLAGPMLSVTGASVAPVALSPSASDPRLLEATIPMSKVKGAGAGSPPSPPLTVTASVDPAKTIEVPDVGTLDNPVDKTGTTICVPALINPYVDDMRGGDANGNKYFTVSCSARFLPSGPKAKPLFLHFLPTSSPTKPASIKVAYSLASHKGGACDEAGRFHAHITDPASLTTLAKGGTFTIDFSDGAYLGLPVQQLTVPLAPFGG
jgi:hypothetical protein